ncbi:hypothetical protein [Flavobacterium sp.]|uniref:hypothetical protein n=1 Tax=Flavobacterium sp. TaxID=239 RepID=UPI0011F7BA8B|nr:hypothetical protein [Flavobacterium sp.]RZJ72476.1 MAG: hypothetical protein EOO49_06065 [Flavobacterium sp.]
MRNRILLALLVLFHVVALIVVTVKPKVDARTESSRFGQKVIFKFPDSTVVYAKYVNLVGRGYADSLVDVGRPIFIRGRREFHIKDSTRQLPDRVDATWLSLEDNHYYCLYKNWDNEEFEDKLIAEKVRKVDSVVFEIERAGYAQISFYVGKWKPKVLKWKADACDSKTSRFYQIEALQPLVKSNLNFGLDLSFNTQTPNASAFLSFQEGDSLQVDFPSNKIAKPKKFFPKIPEKIRVEFLGDEKGERVVKSQCSIKFDESELTFVLGNQNGTAMFEVQFGENHKAKKVFVKLNGKKIELKQAEVDYSTY